MLSKNISFLTRLLTDSPKPEVVSVNLTQLCNQKCKYCEIGAGLVKPEKPLLNLEDMKWVIDQMAKEEIPLLSIGGGEPLLVRWLWDVLEYAEENGVGTEIITNGSIIPSLNPLQLNYLRSTQNVSVSIDTMDKEHEDFLRGVERTLEKQSEAIKILQSEKIPFSIATVVSNINYLDLEELVRTMDRYGARFIKFQPVWTGTNFPGTTATNKKPLVLGTADLPKLVKELKEVEAFEKEHNIKTNAAELLDWVPKFLTNTVSMPFYKTFVNKYWCHSLHSILTINYYGEILPCNYLSARVNIKDRESENLLVAMWDRACFDARALFKGNGHYSECMMCTNSLDMSVICSGIRHPISNIGTLPSIGKKIVQKIRKQKAMKR